MILGQFCQSVWRRVGKCYLCTFCNKRFPVIDWASKDSDKSLVLETWGEKSENRKMYVQFQVTRWIFWGEFQMRVSITHHIRSNKNSAVLLLFSFATSACSAVHCSFIHVVTYQISTIRLRGASRHFISHSCRMVDKLWDPKTWSETLPWGNNSDHHGVLRIQAAAYTEQNVGSLKQCVWFNSWGEEASRTGRD